MTVDSLDVGVGIVFLAALVTAVATGLGALPFVFSARANRRWLGIANAVAAGLMLGASFVLVVEGGHYGAGRTAIGVVLGLVAIAYARRLIERREEVQIGQLQGADATKAILIIGVMTIHSIAEGVGVGVAFGGGESLGSFITAAIALHNVPEGLAISLVMVPRGTPVWQAAGWSIFSSLPQPIMAVPAYLFVTQFEPFLPVGLGMAAGAMLWMTLAELLPDAMRDASRTTVVVTAASAAGVMLAFQNWLKG